MLALQIFFFSDCVSLSSSSLFIQLTLTQYHTYPTFNHSHIDHTFGGTFVQSAQWFVLYNQLRDFWWYTFLVFCFTARTGNQNEIFYVNITRITSTKNHNRFFYICTVQNVVVIPNAF